MPSPSRNLEVGADKTDGWSRSKSCSRVLNGFGSSWRGLLDDDDRGDEMNRCLRSLGLSTAAALSWFDSGLILFFDALFCTYSGDDFLGFADGR